MKTIKTRLTGFILFVLSASSLFLTCDIGLGSSVDTKPPTVSITYPPVQSVIKNTFTMKGVAADETSLASVTVAVLNTVTSATYGPYTATVDTEATGWSVALNNHTGALTYEIPDGTYEMTVTAKDSAGRTSVAKTTYKIDNTAPVVVLNRPGTVGPLASTTPEVFGTELKVTGSANDDNSIERLVFTVYDGSGVLLGSPISVSNISGVGMDITLARYYASPATPEETNLKAIYEAIYGNNPSAGTKQFYFTVDVSDAAREFSPPAAVASALNVRGNTSSKWYVYSDIYSAIFSASGFGVTMKDLTAIFNGSYSGATNAASVIAALKLHENVSSPWSTSSGTFSLNPENSPTYSLIGYSPITSSTGSNPVESNKVSNASNISVKISAGRDQKPLESDTFKVYLDPCNAEGIPLGVANDEIQLLPTVAEIVAGTDVPDMTESARSLKISPTGNDYVIALNIGTVATKKDYLVVVVGYDQEGNGIDVNNGKYGFRVISNGKPPVISITGGPADLANLNSNSVSYDGTVTCESGFGTLDGTVSVYNAISGALVKTRSTVSLGETWALPVDTLTDTLTTGLFQFVCEFVATDTEGNITTLTRRLYIDHAAPIVEIVSFGPTVTVGGTEYVNGQVDFSALCSDTNGIGSTKYLVSTSSSDPGYDAVVGTPSEVELVLASQSIDTAVLGAGMHYLWVETKDRAGNSAAASKAFIVNPTTDLPVIALTNMTVGGTAADNKQGSGAKVTGTLEDDDNLDASSFQIQVDGGSWTAVTGYSNGKNISFQSSFVALTQGVHTYSLRVSDLASAKSGKAAVQTTIGAVSFAYDTADPVLAVADTSGEWHNSSFDLNGTAEDSYGIKSADISIDGGSSWTNLGTWASLTGAQSWTYTIPASLFDGSHEGSYTYQVRAVDAFDKTTVQDFTFKVDTKIDLPVVLTPVSSSYQTSASVTVLGTAADVAGGSQITAVYYAIAVTEPTVPASGSAALLAANWTGSTWAATTGTTYWSASLSALAEGSRKVWVRAVDVAGNISAIPCSRSFNVDLSAPEITNELLDGSTPGVGTIYRNAAFTIGASLADTLDLAGVTVTQKYNGGAAQTIALSVPDLSGAANTSATLDVTGLPRNPADTAATLLQSGIFEYTVTLTDAAGRTASFNRTITVDTTNPTGEFISVSPLVGTNTVNGTISLNMAASDNNSVDALRWWVLPSGTTPVWTTAGYAEDLAAPYTATFDTSALSGSYDICILVRDKAGNTSTLAAYPILIDQTTDLPVITLTNMAVGGSAVANMQGTGAKVTGTLEDDDSLDASSFQIQVDSGSWTTVAGYSNGKSISFQYSFGALTQGVHTYSLRVSDLASAKSGKAAVQTTIGPVSFAYDTADPVLAVADTSGEWHISSFELNGTAEDSYGIKSADISIDGGSSWANLGTWASLTGAQAWTYTIPAGLFDGSHEGIHTYQVRAVDAFDKTTVQAFTFKIDTLISTPSVSVPLAGSYQTSASVTVLGMAADVAGGSQITAVYYAVAASEPTVPASGSAVLLAANWTGAGWKATTGTDNWNANLASLTEGAKTIWVRSIDAAGNVSTVSCSRSFNVDLSAPEITNELLDGSTPGVGTIYRNAAFTIGASLADTLDLAGVTVTQKYNGGAAQTIALSVPDLSGAANTSATLDVTGLPRNPADTAATLLQSGIFEYTVTLTDAAGRTASFNRTITVDTTNPTGEFISVSPLVGTNTVNGTISLNMAASDNNSVDALRWWVLPGGTIPVWTTAGYAEDTAAPYTATFDTSALSGSYDICILVRDKAGNTSALAAYPILIDQTTDLPVVTLTSLAASVTAQANAKDNLLVTGGVISGTITDDDGVAGATITIKNSSGVTVISGDVLTLTGSPKSKTFSYSAGSVPSDGAYSVTIDAFDTNGTAIHSAAMTPVWFAYDSALPTVTLDSNATDSSPIGPYRNASFTLKGTVYDGSGVSKLEISYDNGLAWIVTGIITAAGEASPFNWTWAIDADSHNGAKTLLLRVTDAFGRVSLTSSVSVTIDTVMPSLAIAAFASGYYADTQLAISGTASDATSGLDKVEYSITSASTGFNPVTGTTDWFKNDISTSIESETAAPATRTVWVRSVDRAGNVSPVATQTFSIDHGAPAITVDSSFDGSVYKNGDFPLFGTISDANLGSTPVAITATKDGSAHTLTNSISPNGTTWSRSINLSGSGVYVFTITATDGFGRSSTATRTVTVDTTSPSLEITSVLPQLSGAVVNGKITLAANASDTNGLDGVKYFLRSDTSTPNYTDATTAPLGGVLAAPYSAVIDTTASGITDDTYTLWVVAQDRAGNVTKVSTTITVNQGSDAPAGTIESPASGDAIGTDKKVRGTFSDDDGVASGGAVLYIRKASGSWSSKAIPTASSAGQLVAWTVDVSDTLTAGGDGTYEIYLSVTDNALSKNGLFSTTASTATRSFTYDVTSPTVSTPTVSPVQTAYKSGDVLTISWTATDLSGIAAQVMDVDSSSTGLGSINSTGAPTYSVDYTVPSSSITSGNKTFTVVTSDTTGRTTTRTVTFLVDVDAPVVENAYTLNPGFVGFTPNGTFLVKGTASDNRALAGVQVNLSGPTLPGGSGWIAAALSNGNWSYSLDSSTYVAASGTLVISVRATDQAGNTSSALTFNQAVDQNADKPTVAVISPVAASTYGTTVQISGTAADDDNLADLDNNSIIDADAITIEYNTAQTETGATTVNPSISGSGKNATWNYSATSLAGGTWYSRVRAKDDNGTYGDWTPWVGFTVDTGAPVLTVATDFSTLVYTNNSALTITGIAEDSNGLKYVHARINGGSWILATAAGMTDSNSDGKWDSLATGTVSWTINLNLGSDGLKTIEIAASDANDLVASVQKSTTLDATAPSGAFDSQFQDNPSGSYISTAILNKSVRITGTVTELNLRDTNPIELSIDGGAYVPVTNTFVWSFVWDTATLPDGPHTLRLLITDKAGNVTSSISKTVTTSQGADIPAITQAFVTASTSSVAGNNVLGTLLKVSGTISDDDGFLSGAMSILLDGSTTITASNSSGTTATWDYTWSSLTQGIHFLTLTATDRNGGIASLGPTYFLVDTANPTLTLSTPTAGAKIKAGTLSITGTAVDGGGFGATPVAVTLRHSDTSSSLHGSTYALALSGSTFSLDIPVNSAVKDGTLYIDIVLTDLAGKTSSITRAITIDTTAPSLSLTYPSESAYINGLVSVTGTADDLNGLSGVTMEIINPSTFLPITALTRSGSTLSSWSFPYNSTTYASTTYGHDVNGDEKLWKVWFRLMATDNSGNQKILQPAAVSASAVNTSTGAITLPSTVVSELTVGEPVYIDGTTLPAGLTSGTLYYLRSKPSSTTITVSATSGGSIIVPTTSGADVTVQAAWPCFYIDTDGDKPTISVTQPKNGEKIGGIVNMYGTAVDDDGPVMQVEVQIDFNGDGDFADTRDIDNNGTTSLGSNTDILGRTVKIGDSAHKWEDESAWYVVSSTNNAWTLELNSNGELYKSNTGGNGDIVINVRTRDVNGLASEISTRTITLDETFPRIENITPADVTYQSGTFHLLADFGDNLDLNLASNSQIRINVNKGGYQTLSEGAHSNYTLTADLADPQNGYDLDYTIDTTAIFPGSSGILYVDLYVKDESSYTNQKSFTYYVDNQTPTTSWSDRSGAPDGLGTRNGQIAINGTVNDAFIEGNYLDSGSVSGIDHIEVYFAKGDSIQKITGVASQTAATTESTAVDIYNSSTGVWNDSNSDGVSETATSATLPFVKWSDSGYGNDYVIKIDKATEMSSISTGSDTDGDGYYEFLGIDGGAQRWRAYFNSLNLPDGAIDIHYIVYDLAGNRIHKVRRGFIANNGPQFDRIRVGSDYNGSGTVADVSGAVTEILDYYYPAGSIDRLSASSPIKVKNGKLYFNIVSSDPNGTNNGIASTVVNLVSPSGLLTSFSGASGGNVANDPLNPISITVPSTQFPTAGDYTLEVVVKDNDGIMARRNVVIKVLNTADATGPTVTPATHSVSNSIPLDGDSNKLGHIELQTANTTSAWSTISAAYGSDNDPKVSGKITLKGTIYDENRIGSVDVTVDGIGTNHSVAAWSGGKLTSTDANFTIDTQTLSEDGHTVTYTYVWDTSTVTGTAALNKTVAFRALDATSNISAAHAALKYDVVPYISKLVRHTDYNTLRSRYGRFLFHRGEAMYIHGFNIFNTTADSVVIGGATILLPSGSTNALAEVTIPASAKSGEVVLKVSSFEAINNKNDNDKSWNSEASVSPGTDGSTYWNDDRYVHVWQSDDNQSGADRGYFTGSADPEYPAMSFDATNRVLYGSWENYASANVYYGVNNGGSTMIFHGYDPQEHTDIHYGTRPNVAINANMYGNGTWDVIGAGGTYVWNSQATTANEYSGTAYSGVYNAEALYHDKKLMQFINQRIVTDGNNIHLSYYDTDTKALKYWYHLSGANAAYAQSWINIDGGCDSDDGTATNVTATKATTGVTYVSTAVATNSISNRNGTIATINTGLIGTYVTSGTTVIATTTQNIRPSVSGVLTGFLVSVGSTVTSGVTPVASVQEDTTVATVHQAVGNYVNVGSNLVTMANGTVVTSTTAGYVSTILAIGDTVTHNTTTVATIATVYVSSIQKAVGSVVAAGTVIATLSDASTVTATSAGMVSYVAPVGTPVGASTLIATTITTTRTATGSRSAAAGEYSAIDVTPTNRYPVIAYYDITNQTVKIARATAVNPTGSQWALQTVMTSGGDTNYKYSGKYVTMKLDSSGYMHLVFYRNSTGDLIYMKSTNHPTDGSTAYAFGSSVILDSIGSVGIWADITLNGSTPYVSYLDSSLVNTFDGVKMAYYSAALERVSGDVAGEPDTSDGWETMNAPLTYEVESVRTSIEYDTSAGGFWSAAIGYSAPDYFRIAYYVKE